MSGGRSAVPGDPLRGLEADCRSLGADIRSTGFGYVDLPADYLERRRVISRARGYVRVLSQRLAPMPVGGMVVNRDPEGDGPYYMVYAGERPVLR